MFGAGTACVVSPIEGILYEGEMLQIPTMENPEVTNRCMKELLDIQVIIIKGYFFFSLHINLCCGCSLESPRHGDSSEHPQHRFMRRTDKNYLSIIIKYFYNPV